MPPPIAEDAESAGAADAGVDDSDQANDEATEQFRWRRFHTVTLTAALMFLAAVVGWALAQGGRPDRDSVDAGFLYDMIYHHEQAQQMATLELGQGASDDVKVFAREILLFQSYEIGLMEAKLNEWGYLREDRPNLAMEWMGMPTPPGRMPGMASETEIGLLIGAEGAEADAQFLSLMIRHHQGGIHMADAAARDAKDGDVRALATRISRNQRLEIGELERARQRLQLPAGVPTTSAPPASHEGHG